LEGLGKLATKYDVHIQSHAAETPHQVKMVHDMYPNLGGGRDVAIFESVGLLTAKTSFAHGCHLRDEEVEKMAVVGASVAVCPYANMLHSFAVSPIPRWNKMGMSVGLGTDIAGGYNASMVGVARLATLADRIDSFMDVKRTLPPREQWPEPQAPSRDNWLVDWVYAFHLATAGGAAALALAKEIGIFENGMQFDALLVDFNVEGQAFEYWEGPPLLEQIERWWNTGDDRNIRRVWVQGRCVLEV
jgi:guanine deaminase